MSRRLIVALLGLAGLACSAAVVSGLVDGRAGAAAAGVLYIASGMAWWVPGGRE